jgi:PIN domain nuclease of toxin-antitoxin system
MRLLLDTHSFLWFLLDDPKLSKTARDSIADPDNDDEISPASYWEIAIKISLKKYSLPEPYEQFMERELATNQFRILPIEPKHTAALTSLPFHHRDPSFDRLIIAQAMVERIPVISRDEAFTAYPVTRIW